MKRTVKCVLCLLLVLLLCVSASGCKELDRARTYHAILNQDGSLSLDGQTYLALPHCEEFTPPMGTNIERVVVTESDVPVLVKDFFFETVMNRSEDGRFLEENGAYYCLEDDYESISSRIEEGFQPTDMRYAYSVYKDGDWFRMSYTLTEEQKAAVLHVLETVEPRKSEENNAEHRVQLEESSKDGWFGRFFCGLGKVGEQYMLYTGDSFETVFLLYDVPTEQNGVFGEIMADYLCAENRYVMVTS